MIDDGPTLATDLVPPPLPSENDSHIPWLDTELTPPEYSWENEEKLAMLFLINIFALQNKTDEDSNDVLHDDISEEFGKFKFPDFIGKKFLPKI